MSSVARGAGWNGARDLAKPSSEARVETFCETGICAIRRPFGADFMARLDAAIDGLLTPKPGTRAFALADEMRGAFTRIAASVAGKPVRLVRILAFDKTRERNWGVAWHQDRTIAVRSRVDLPGFGPWSVKSGVPHVEPPLALMEQMLVLRYHADDCGPANGPLKVVAGSHALGRVPVAEVTRLVASSEIVTCAVEAGDILAMKALTVHGSEPAAAPSHRRVLHMDFTSMSLPRPLEWAIGAEGAPASAASM